MQAQESLSGTPLTELGQPVAELPVKSVASAQRHYCEKLGFEACWNSGNEIGSVKRGNAAIFFRRREGAFEPAVHWFYAATGSTFTETRP